MIRLVVESLNLDGKYIFVTKDDIYLQELKSEVKSLKIDSKIVLVRQLTRGPAESCLAASDQIKNQEELVIANSDQIMWWDSSQFISCARTPNLDGLIVTYTSSSPSNSYAIINRNGQVKEVREKEVVSDIALTGIHYWRHGKDFVYSANKMINEKILSHNEFFVGPSYNLLINAGFKIGLYHIPNFQHNPVGKSSDLDKYKEKICKNLE